jgi:CBS domain-containing protein
MSRLDSKKKGKMKVKPLNSRNLELLSCERWMTLEVHTVKPLDCVAHARALLEEHRINELPVVKDGMLVGIVTDRDLRDAFDSVTTSAKLAGAVEPVPQTPDAIPVEAVMTRNVITLAPHSSVVNAAVVMRRERIGSVPIVDGGCLAGIVTRSDVLDAFVSRENGRRERADQAVPTKRKVPKRETTR